MTTVSACVTAVGEARTLPACLEALAAQTPPVYAYVVRDVSPFSAAQQQMVDRCATDLVVQVDEDMVLLPDAVRRLASRIEASPPDVVMSCMPLMDVYLNKIIYGVKIYRTELVRRVPFEPHSTGDGHDRALWTRAGMRTTAAPLELAHVVGRHGTDPTPEQLFERWRRLWQNLRAGKSVGWIQEWPERLAQRYRDSGSRRDLMALLGAAVGASEPPWPDDHAPDFRRDNPALDRLLEMFHGVR